MKKLCLWGISLAAGTALAAETFGGMGLAIYPSATGAEVASVVQGAPAHLAGIEVGDYLLSADSVSLAGETLEFDMEVLRGTPGKTVELAVLRNADTLFVQVKREAIVVKKASEESSNFAFKTNGEDALTFLDAVELPGLEANVYAANLNIPDESLTRPFENLGKAKLRSFDRDFIRFDVEASGEASVEIFSAHGERLESLRMECLAGSNQLAWNGKSLSPGSYYVRISQNGKSLQAKGVLR